MTVKESLKKIYSVSRLFGFNPKVLALTIKGFPVYLRDLSEFKKQKGDDDKFVFGPNRPILTEKSSESGTMSGHYFHQDLLIARRIFLNNPRKHIDIGSRIDGFVAHVAVFREIEVFDIRPQVSKVKNIHFRQADLTTLPGLMDDYCDSISALHSLEHFGLGRYGDPIDYYGYLKGIENVYRILQTGGIFYFSVPIGKQRIEFNAHRVFSLRYLLDLFQSRFLLKNFSYVNDAGDLFENFQLTLTDIENNLQCRYGCGIFEWIKR